MLRKRDGVVIIAVLWICALIMWFAMRVSSETRLQGEEQAHLLRRSQALHLAIGGCYEALGRMGQPPPSGLHGDVEDYWQPDGRFHVVEYQTGKAVVVIEREDRKININKANHEQVKILLERTGMEDGAAGSLSDVILDFVSKSDLTRLHGMKKDQYKEAGLHYGPFNGPLVRLDQMLLIPGVTQQAFYGYTRTGDDPDTEDTGILLPSKDSLFQMLTVYGTNVAVRENSQEQILQNNTWGMGGIFRILSAGKAYSGPPSVTLWLVVRFAPGTPEGYQILYRKIL